MTAGERYREAIPSGGTSAAMRTPASTGTALSATACPDLHGSDAVRVVRATEEKEGGIYR